MLWNLYKFKELEDNYQVEVRRLPQGAPKELGRTQGSRCSERYVIHPSSFIGGPGYVSNLQHNQVGRSSRTSGLNQDLHQEFQGLIQEPVPIVTGNPEAAL